MERFIYCTFQKEGIHRYPAAGTDEKLKDVDFLQYEHRHMFHFRVDIEVYHNDRDLEFIQFKRWLESLYNTDMLQLNHKSCEMIAEDLYAKIQERYPGRRVTIQVAEDNENGAVLKFDGTK